MYEKMIDFLETNASDKNAQNELSRVFGYTQATSSRKLNGLLEFKSAEIRLFRKKYNLSPDETIDLFEL